MERFEKIYLNRWRKEIKSKGCDMEKNKKELREAK